MPTYVFRCPQCHTEYEFSVSVSELPSLQPTCNLCKVRLRRVFTPVGIRFVGPGFHVNDYPKQGSK